jgi:hypothetical protein
MGKETPTIHQCSAVHYRSCTMGLLQKLEELLLFLIIWKVLTKASSKCDKTVRRN